jgi:hypothetical protein
VPLTVPQVGEGGERCSACEIHCPMSEGSCAAARRASIWSSGCCGGCRGGGNGGTGGSPWSGAWQTAGVSSPAGRRRGYRVHGGGGRASASGHGSHRGGRGRPSAWASTAAAPGHRCGTALILRQATRSNEQTLLGRLGYVPLPLVRLAVAAGGPLVGGGADAVIREAVPDIRHRPCRSREASPSRHGSIRWLRCELPGPSDMHSGNRATRPRIVGSIPMQPRQPSGAASRASG